MKHRDEVFHFRYFMTLMRNLADVPEFHFLLPALIDYSECCRCSFEKPPRRVRLAKKNKGPLLFQLRTRSPQLRQRRRRRVRVAA